MLICAAAEDPPVTNGNSYSNDSPPPSLAGCVALIVSMANSPNAGIAGASVMAAAMIEVTHLVVLEYLMMGCSWKASPYPTIV